MKPYATLIPLALLSALVGALLAHQPHHTRQVEPVRVEAVLIPQGRGFEVEERQV